ncbi:hypothetical protein ACIRRA_44830 [Nocardia sp. NPDC101769]
MVADDNVTEIDGARLRLVAERTGEDYIDTDRTCVHIDAFWGGRKG